MRTYLEQADVSDIINTASSCEDKISLLLTIVKTGLDAITLLQSKVVHITEPPWINYSLKNLIRERQSELNQGNLEGFRHLRNRVNRERSSSSWWKNVKKLSGVSKPGTEDCNILKSFHHLEGVI